jgi:hypothetical protein
MSTEQGPYAELLALCCQTSGCDNDAEGECSLCGERLCFACFNAGHEWDDH